MCDYICRTCLSLDSLEPIFADTNAIDKRCKDLFYVTGVKIQPNDGLTQHLCKFCSEIINNSLKLRLKSAESERILLQKKYDIEKERINQKYPKKRKRNNIIQAKINNLAINEISEVVINELNEIELNEYETNELGLNESNETENEIENSNDNVLSDVNGDDKADNEVKPKKIETRKFYKRKRLSKVELQKYMSLAIITSKNGPVRCKLCSKELRERRFFVNHAKTHFEGENTCEFCGKKFVSRNSMRYHQQRKHGALKKHACAACPYRAVDHAQLVNHERSVHTGCRPYSCHVCGDKFTSRAAVAQHLRKHFATYNVQCEKCPALFRSRSELASHRNRVHLMLYTYSCYLCQGKDV